MMRLESESPTGYTPEGLSSPLASVQEHRRAATAPHFTSHRSSRQLSKLRGVDVTFAVDGSANTTGSGIGGESPMRALRTRIPRPRGAQALDTLSTATGTLRDQRPGTRWTRHVGPGRGERGHRHNLSQGYHAGFSFITRDQNGTGVSVTKAQRERERKLCSVCKLRQWCAVRIFANGSRHFCFPCWAADYFRS